MEPRLILERPCEHGLYGPALHPDYHPVRVGDEAELVECPGGTRTTLDPDRQIHLEGATGRGFDALISDIIDALLSEADD